MQPVPVPPVFDNVVDERRSRLERLTAAYRLFARFDYSEGTAGHITVRDPEFPEEFWVAPFGIHFALITVSDLVRVNSDGEVTVGDRPINDAAFAIHSRIHAARPDVIAAAHAHSLAGKAWSTTGRLLDPLTQDACAFYDDHAVFDRYSGVVLELSEGDRIAETLGGRKAAILQNHGLLTVGGSVDEAAYWFIAMDRACDVQLRAEAAQGVPTKLDHETARKTCEQIGSPYLGWLGFQPLYDWVTSEEPQCLR